MLHEFLDTYRDEIIARTRRRVRARRSPASSTGLEDGVPMFLTQLVETLRLQHSATPVAASAIGLAATRHGRDLLAIGYTVSQVVHDYGEVCQAVTELAVELALPITTEEFKVLNGCLDVAIAEAVTEHARLTGEARTVDELERMGRVTHEIRNMLNSALLAFNVIQRGTVGVNGSTGAVLGRSLTGLRDLVDSALSDLRTAAGHERAEVLRLATVLDETAVAAHLQAGYSGLLFVVEPVDDALTVHVDPQLLTSAVTNLLSNAFKYTPRGGRVVLRAGLRDGRIAIEVQDACGGIPERSGDLFQPFGERHGSDRSGLGLGLSIARKAIRAQGGDIVVRNTPGEGCTFVIDLPQAVDAGLGLTEEPVT